MERLATRDLRAILDFTLDARAFARLESFRTGILAGINDLIPCDMVGYNEVDTAEGTLVVFYDRSIPEYDEIARIFPSVMHQHPMVATADAGDGRTYKLSDFFTTREFHRLELYQDMYRLVGAEEQMAFSILGEVIVGIALNRQSRSFTERDRTILELVRPHLAQAYGEVREREAAAALIEALEAGLEERAGAMIVLGAGGSVVHAGEPARELLSAYLGPPAGGGSPLPAELLDWLASHDPDRHPQPLRVEGPRGFLTVRLLALSASDGHRALLLEERRPRPPGIAALMAFGLTRRQAEVLRLMAMGKDNDEIARSLFVSPATVRKHVEHIYRRLGVSSRAAAVATALGSPNAY